MVVVLAEKMKIAASREKEMVVDLELERNGRCSAVVDVFFFFGGGARF